MNELSNEKIKGELKMIMNCILFLSAILAAFAFIYAAWSMVRHDRKMSAELDK